MLFFEYSFLFVFLPCVLGVYSLLPAGRRNAWIFLASCAFYAASSWIFLPLLLGSVLVDYVAGGRIARAQSLRARRAWLTLSVAANLGVLAFFKYSGMLTSSFRALLGPDSIPLVDAALPVGISFYTFQSMSYTIDLYRGRVETARSLADFGAYVTLFPQLIAGPIVRFSHLQEQLRERIHSWERFAAGIQTFVVGLAKKLLVADTLASLSAPIFAAGHPGALDAWTAMLLFAGQIYFDFSGYSDMAIGLGRMMGFELPQNFDAPYRATSFADFWRRWHITLSTWLRDYLYIPLGGSRRGMLRTYVNLTVTMLLGGLWHGASWNFVLWGGAHGTLLAAERLLRERGVPGAAGGGEASAGLPHRGRGLGSVQARRTRGDVDLAVGPVRLRRRGQREPGAGAGRPALPRPGVAAVAGAAGATGLPAPRGRLRGGAVPGFHLGGVRPRRGVSVPLLPLLRAFMDASKRFVLIMAGIWAVLLAVSLRFEPPEFRPWERLYDEGQRRFQPSARIEMQEIGDLGYKSWVRALQHPRRARFTTDRWGFRNAEDIERPRVVVVGDSYVAGSGLSDEETLTARLSTYLGEPVYNFGTQYLNGPALFLREERFARNKPAVVIYAPVARAIKPRPLFYRQWGKDEEPQDLLSRQRRIGRAILEAVDRTNQDNGLVREARFLYQGLLRALRGHPGEIQAPEGQPVLALSLEEQNLYASAQQRDLDETLAMLATFDGVLRQAGVRLVFCPIPESGSIYPASFPVEQRRSIAQPSFLDGLIAGARELGIEVVDLRTTYRQDPAPYLFQPDDSHWNARATDLAARALAQALDGKTRLAAGPSPR